MFLNSSKPPGDLKSPITLDTTPNSSSIVRSTTLLSSTILDEPRGITDIPRNHDSELGTTETTVSEQSRMQEADREHVEIIGKRQKRLANGINSDDEILCNPALVENKIHHNDKANINILNDFSLADLLKKIGEKNKKLLQRVFTSKFIKGM